MIAMPEYDSHWPNLLKILVREAIKHGLVLCDEEVALVILPDGSVLPTNFQRYESKPLIKSKDTREFPVTLKQFYQLIQRDIGKLLMTHGFLADEQESWSDNEFEVRYDKAIKMGKLSLFIGFDGRMESFEPSLYFRIIEDHMVAIAQKSDFKYSMMLGGGISLSVLSILKLRGDEFCIDGWEKFEELLSLLTASVLRWSDAITDIKGIDALLNGDADEAVKNYVSSYLYSPYALIAARLAGNPHFEELALDLGAYGSDSGRMWGIYGSSVTVGWPKLVNYLREEIKPLADWPDGFLAHLQGKETHNDPTDAPITMEQLDEHFKIKMGELARLHGFVLTKQTELSEYLTSNSKAFIVVYDKAIDKGMLSLQVHFDNYFPSIFSPSISLTITETTMMKVAEQLNFSDVVRCEKGVVLSLSPTLESKNSINSWRKLEKLLSLLKNSVMRWSDSVIVPINNLFEK